MKCMKCSKNIPDVSTTCPFCDHPVGVYVKDKDKITIPDDDEDLTYVKSNGKIDKRDEMQLEAYIDETKQKKYKIGIVAIVVLVVIIIFLGAFIATNFSGKKKAEDYHPLFTDTIKTFFQHFIEEYTGNYSIGSGEYKIKADINYDSYVLNGTYGFDTKNRILALTGQFFIDDPDEVVVDYDEINFSFYLRRDEAYLSSKEIFDKPILFPINDKIGYLAAKSYDLESLLSGLEEALIKAFDKMELTTVDDNINHMGISRDVNKTSVTLNNEARREFYKVLYQTLLDNSNFINEYARVKGVTSTVMNDRIQELLDDVDYTYPLGTDEKTIISIYHEKLKLYRIEIIINGKDSNKNIELDSGNDNNYTLSYYEDGKNIFNASLEFSSKEAGDIIRKKYKITYDDDDAQRNFDIEILKDKTPSLKKITFKDVVNVRDLTPLDYLSIEKNMRKFMADVSWIRKLGASFNNVCTPELKCNCPTNAKKCSCTYNGTLIECDKEDVTKREDPEEDDEDNQDEEKPTDNKEDEKPKDDEKKEDDDVVIIG